MIIEKMTLQALVLIACAPSAILAANTWTGTGDWNTAANWSEGVPVAGQDVVVDGNAMLTNATPALASLTVNGTKTLTFDGWDTLLTATTVTIAGTVTHAQNTDTNAVDGWTPSARVNIACSTLEVTAGGKIDVNYRGYLGGQTANKDGHGPGRGRGRGGADSSDGGAGGYGGTGGTAFKSGFMNYGLTYGSSTLPEDPGSGGGSGNTDAADGGAGGGSVRIVATGTVAVNGHILANGGNGPEYGGAGSGGGVFIDCLALSGSGGVVSAIGGNGASRSGGGGGGRIAVNYDVAAQTALPVPDVQFTTLPGPAVAASAHLYGDVGTLHFTDSQILTRAAGTIHHSGQWLAPGLGVWEPDALAMANAWLRFPQSGLSVDVANQLALTGADPLLHKLELTNAVLACGGDAVLNKVSLTLRPGEASGPSAVIGGDLVVSNSAAFHIHCGATNQTMEAYSSRVAVDGDAILSTGGWILPYSHPLKGGHVQFEMANLRVLDATAGFNASEKGFAGGQKSMIGYGPGGGAYMGGGGHGGFGGGWTATQGGVYGTDQEPREPGSGGGGGDNASAIGGSGGGAIVILATGDVLMNGGLLANGGKYAGNGHAAGGAGGGVYIDCQTFGGTGGTVSAVGGQGDYNGGGGGRIAIAYDPVAQSNAPLPSVKFTTLPGTAVGNNKVYGDVGTLHFPDSQFLTRETGTIRHAGQWKAPGLASWTRDALALDGAWLRLLDSMHAVSISDDIAIKGTDAKLHKLELIAADVDCGGDIVVDKGWLGVNAGTASPRSLTCGGSLFATNGALIHVYGGVTNGTTPEYGLLLDVAGDLVVGAGSWLHPYSHPTNGASVQINAKNLLIPAAGGGVDGTGRGYGGGRQNAPGFGPGRGQKQGGGGHGGGGSGRVGEYGQANGVAHLPVGAGSGGGGGDQSFSVGGFGGAAVRIRAFNQVLANGSILAHGGAGNTGAHDAGGAGGGIFIACRKFTGSGGTVAANGGTGKDNRSGGGGRIAIWENVPPDYTAFRLAHAEAKVAPESFSGTITVTAPTSGVSPAAEPGTIRYYNLKPRGGLIVVR